MKKSVFALILLSLSGSVLAGNLMQASEALTNLTANIDPTEVSESCNGTLTVFGTSASVLAMYDGLPFDSAAMSLIQNSRSSFPWFKRDCKADLSEQDYKTSLQYLSTANEHLKAAVEVYKKSRSSGK